MLRTELKTPQRSLPPFASHSMEATGDVEHHRRLLSRGADSVVGWQWPLAVEAEVAAAASLLAGLVAPVAVEIESVPPRQCPTDPATLAAQRALLSPD